MVASKDIGTFNPRSKPSVTTSLLVSNPLGPFLYHHWTILLQCTNGTGCLSPRLQYRKRTKREMYEKRTKLIKEVQPDVLGGSAEHSRCSF
jgi:hypothetical protein